MFSMSSWWWPLKHSLVRYILIIVIAIAVASAIAKTTAESAVDTQMKARETKNVRESYEESQPPSHHPTASREQVKESFVTELNSVIERLSVLSDIMLKSVQAGHTPSPATVAEPNQGGVGPRANPRGSTQPADDAPDTVGVTEGDADLDDDDVEAFVTGIEHASSLNAQAHPFRIGRKPSPVRNQRTVHNNRA